MYFTQEYPLRMFECMMQENPNFLPRGRGVYIISKCRSPADLVSCQHCIFFINAHCQLQVHSETQQKITAGIATYQEILLETMSSITNPAFRKRILKYIKESENNTMNYYSPRHKNEFGKVAEHLNKDNNKLISAVYLLSADTQLWRKVKNHVSHNSIDFGGLTVGTISESAYTLLCCAKDLYLGTKHITIADLADEDLISSKLFGIICNAMAIRRFGINTITETEDNKC